ncbi:MAG TPA: hypothetical protein DCS88_09035 [Alphaproteobacteria bacterium]|nr:hypothetical protein [Alphaproteobacteria bacterium]
MLAGEVFFHTRNGRSLIAGQSKKKKRVWKGIKKILMARFFGRVDIRSLFAEQNFYYFFCKT